ATQEIVWKPVRLRVVTGPRSAIMVDSDGIASLEPVSGRHIVWDVINDRPYINMGSGAFVDPISDPTSGAQLQKFIVHATHGDGYRRQRGYMFAEHLLFYLKGLSLERFAVTLETYGVSTPFLQLPQDGFLQDEEIADAEQILTDHGKGIPAVVPGKY